MAPQVMPAGSSPSQGHATPNRVIGSRWSQQGSTGDSNNHEHLHQHPQRHPLSKQSTTYHPPGLAASGSRSSSSQAQRQHQALGWQQHQQQHEQEGWDAAQAHAQHHAFDGYHAPHHQPYMQYGSSQSGHASSGSSSGTIAPLSAVSDSSQTQNAAASKLAMHRASDLPSSSSSSSSSASSRSTSQHLHDRHAETPLTAELPPAGGQPSSGTVKQAGQGSQSSDAADQDSVGGFPFPDCPDSKRPRGAGEDGLWKHTDDLLGPATGASTTVSPSTTTNTSAKTTAKSAPVRRESASSTSTGRSGLSALAKPHESSATVSMSQTPTPTAAEMDRRSSQSSSASSAQSLRSRQGQLSAQDLPDSLAAKAQAVSGSTAAAANTAAGPASASFSPLSPHVQPFSPSANAAGLPASMAKTVAAGQSAPARSVRSQSLTASEAHDAQLEEQDYASYAFPPQYARGMGREARHLTGSVASSSADTGYASGYGANNPENASQSASRYPHAYPTSASSAQTGFGFQGYGRGSHDASYPDDLAMARQRSWSEAGALGIVAGPNTRGPPYPPPGHGVELDRTGVQQWAAHKHHPIQEHVESMFDQASTGQEYPLDPRYPAPHPNFGPPPSASASAFQYAGAPAGPHAGRPLPLSRSLENFEAARYGYRPSFGTDMSGIGDEISTIFVVGFPEDIQEREFQNMFLFSRGFEAATLKIPASTAAARERDAAAAAAVSAIAATLPAFNAPPPPPALDPSLGFGGSAHGGPSYDHLNNSLYEETYMAAASGPAGAGSLPNMTGPAGAHHIESAQRVSSALAAAALTASASTANMANTTNRKQIIGFAKFRTREDAMEARDVLSGRKVDPEKGCVLKAEMAKKNLHIKKNGTEVQTPATAVAPQYDALPLASRGSASALDRLAEREREREREWRERMALGPAPADPAMGYDHPYGAGAPDRDYLSQRNRAAPESSSKDPWQDAAYNAFHSVPAGEGPFARADGRAHPVNRRESPEHIINDRAGPQQSTTNVRHRAMTGTSAFGKTLLQQLDEQEDADFDLPDPTPGFGASAYLSTAGETSVRRQPPPALPSALNNMNVGSYGGHSYIDEDYRKLALTRGQITSSPSQTAREMHTQDHYGAHGPSNASTPTSATSAATAAGLRRYTSPDLVSPTHSEFRHLRGAANRADDNTPIATLYVGGLPSALPNLPGEVSASQVEDSLRAVFSRCTGFKRMSYRQKSQGPMCFVEFEDTSSATKALNEVYGHTLGGLVKGGIRLAYSKNPLGVRTSNSSGPDSPTSVSPTYFGSEGFAGQQSYNPSISANANVQASTPTLHSRLAPRDYALNSPHPEQAVYQSGFPRQSNLASGMAPRQSISEHRPAHDRRAVSPSAYPATSFAPFAMDR